MRRMFNYLKMTTAYLSVEPESWVPPAPPWFLGLVKNVRRNLPICTSSPLTSTRRIHRLPVDVGAVEATDVEHVDFVVLPSELRVPAAHGDVVEEDVAAGMSAYRRHRLIQQEPGSGVGASFHDYQRRTRGQRFDGDRAGGAHVGRASGSLRKSALGNAEVVSPVTSSDVWSWSFSVTPAAPFRPARWS